MSKLLDTALAYARNGTPVFPVHSSDKGQCSCNHAECESQGKHPRTQHGFKDATTDESQIKKWWEMWPDANLAIPTGEVSGISVVDIDSPHGEGSYKRHLASLPQSRMHATPNDGKHILFLYNDQLRQGGAFWPGIDTRNDGGYIVVPPSTIDGRPYTVFRDRDMAALVTLPKELLATPSDNGTQPDAPQTENWVSQLLRAGAPLKNRNTSAARLIGYFHSKGMAVDIIAAQMQDFASRCTPPMDPTELHRTIESVTRYQQRAAEAQITNPPIERRHGEDFIYTWEEHQISLSLSSVHHSRDGLQARLEITTTRPGMNPRVHGPVNWGLYSTSGRATLVRYLKSRIEEIDWGSILETTAKLASDTFENSVPVILLSPTNATPPRFAIHPFVSEGETTIMFGRGDGGKSYISLALALAMHSNIQVGPFAPITPHRGLYLDWETNDKTHAWRLKQLLAGQQLEGIATDLPYMRCYAPLTEHLRGIKKAITDFSVSYVVIDSAAAACGGEPEKAEMALRFMNALRSLNVSATVIAHSVKLKSGGMPFGCYSADTEVLTQNGWKNHPDVTIEDFVACFDLETGALKWGKPTALHRYEYDGDMVHLHGASLDMLVTPNHRMVVKPGYDLPIGSSRTLKNSRTWDFHNAEDLGATNWLMPFGTTGINDSRASHPDWQDTNWARFLGWWISEGCLNSGAPVLTQQLGSLADAMKSTVQALGYEYRAWEGRSRPHEQPVMQMRLRGAIPLGAWLKAHCGEGAKNKRLPDLVLSEAPRQWRQALFDALIDGDGHIRKSGAMDYSTTSPQLADDIQALAITLGYSASIRAYPRAKLLHLDRYSVRIGHRKHLSLRTRHHDQTPYTGTVHCLTVPTGAYVTRRNGHTGISGNSVFWHNEPRATFEVIPSLEDRPNEINVGIYNRKSNNAAKSKPVGLQLVFADNAVRLNQIDIQGVPDLASKTSVKDQIFALLKNQQLTVSEIADELELPENTVLQTLNRHKNVMFTALPDTHPTLWARHPRFDEVTS